MSDGVVYEIDYEYKPTGSYTAADAGADPDTIVRTVSSLTTNRTCDQAALYVIQRIQDPQWEEEVTMPKIDAGLSLVHHLSLEGLPAQGVGRRSRISSSPGGGGLAPRDVVESRRCAWRLRDADLVGKRAGVGGTENHGFTPCAGAKSPPMVSHARGLQPTKPDCGVQLMFSIQVI